MTLQWQMSSIPMKVLGLQFYAQDKNVLLRVRPPGVLKTYFVTVVEIANELLKVLYLLLNSYYY